MEDYWEEAVEQVSLISQTQSTRKVDQVNWSASG